MFNALLTLLPQILCPYGYSDVSLTLVYNIMCITCKGILCLLQRIVFVIVELF